MFLRIFLFVNNLFPGKRLFYSLTHHCFWFQMSYSMGNRMLTTWSVFFNFFMHEASLFQIT